jgi:hypothetical protein
MRFEVAEIAPEVDTVIGEQLAGLASALGGALPVSGAVKAAEEDNGLDAVAADLARGDEAVSVPE